MYQLLVFERNTTSPIARAGALSARQVLALIPALLKEHEGCERIEVSLDGAKLFAVDCAGNQLP